MMRKPEEAHNELFQCPECGTLRTLLQDVPKLHNICADSRKLYTRSEHSAFAKEQPNKPRKAWN